MSRVLCTALTGLLLGGVAFAQDEPTKDNARSEAGKKVKVQSVFRLDTITGMSVHSPRGEELGGIEDLVFDLKTGKIRYAALSFGGFASLGDKLFAIPWKELTFKFGEEDSYFVIDATEDELSKAPGFDQDKWPDTADPNWSKTIDAYYAQRKTNGDDGRENPKRAKDAVKPGKLTFDPVYRGANLTGMEVRNKAGEDLGTIHEVVVDVKEGTIRYAALSFGGTLGLGDKLFAIPWKKLTFMHEASDKHFVLNVSKEQLERAKGFDQDHWPAEADLAAIDAHYDDSPREAKVPKREE